MSRLSLSLEQQQNIHNQLLEKLVDDKLDKAVSANGVGDSLKLEPIQSRRPSWSKIRSEYEAKQKAAFWTDRIAEVEGRAAQQEDSVKTQEK